MTEMHGGNVSVSSQPGEGSQFIITLPWKKQASPPPIPLKKPENAAPRILVTDDNQLSVQTISVYLKRHGYHVYVAQTGIEELSLANDIRPNLILMDIHMPEMDGLETIRRLRINRISKNIPVIAVTAMTMPGDKERCLAAGANDYLSKPVNLQILENILSKYLG